MTGNRRDIPWVFPVPKPLEIVVWAAAESENKREDDDADYREDLEGG